MIKGTADLKNKALLLLGHGSSIHPDSSRSVRNHAETIRKRDLFAEVYTAFLKEDLLVENALDHIVEEEVVIVLDFLAEGYFTKQVIPKLLKLSDRSSHIYVSHPVGLNPIMQNIMAEVAHASLGDWKAEETALLLVGHGSTKNSQSKRTMLYHMEQLKAATGFKQIADLWLEEAPFVTEWESVTPHEQVIAIPFLLSDGQHGGWDIPEEFGIEKGVGVHGVTHQLAGRQVRLLPALGAAESFADAILPAALESRQIAPVEDRQGCLYRAICLPQAAEECKAPGCPATQS